MVELLKTTNFEDQNSTGGETSSTHAGDGRIPCPSCSERILPTAKKCRYCGELFTTAGTPALNTAGIEQYGTATDSPATRWFSGFMLVVTLFFLAKAFLGFSGVSSLLPVSCNTSLDCIDKANQVKRAATTSAEYERAAEYYDYACEHFGDSRDCGGAEDIRREAAAFRQAYGR